MTIRTIAVVTSLLIATTTCYAKGASKTISGKHKKNALTCSSCHGSNKPVSPATQEACITCHGEIVTITAREISVGTKVVKVNVHDSHYGEVDCLVCHKIHGTGRLMCNECHTFDITVK